MKKFVVKLSLQRKSVAVKVAFGRDVVIAMTGNTNFTTPSPALTAITTATDDLEAAAAAAAAGGVLQTALLHEKAAEWDLLMTALGAYVDNVAAYSESVILSAGMETKRQRSPIGKPARVENVKATSVSVGELSVKWKPIHGAHAYLGYLQDEDGAKALVLAIKSTKGHAVISNLRSGGRYSIVIEAIGSEGVGELSDKATSVVL